MTWSPQQETAIKAVRTWLKEKSGPQVFRLFGYAGTGKTTLAKTLAKEVSGTVRFAAFTGKAALVLRNKGCGEATTIHSMIYDPKDGVDGDPPEFELKRRSELRHIKLIIIDECSMVDESLGRDLLSFGLKVLVLGDPAQLPPVSGAGFFTEGVNPDIMLTEIHRQARDNPIIAMSIAVREGRTLTPGAYGNSRVIPASQIDAETILAADQVIVGLNKTRVSYNKRIRSLLGRESVMPTADDKLVCLRNDQKNSLLNGGLWRVHNSVDGRNSIILTISSEDDDTQSRQCVKVRSEFFTGEEETLTWSERRATHEFTYGYALTCHKSQGSQWKNIVIFDEGYAFRKDAVKWRYTAITRAAEQTTIVI